MEWSDWIKDRKGNESLEVLYSSAGNKHGNLSLRLNGELGVLFYESCRYAPLFRELTASGKFTLKFCLDSNMPLLSCLSFKLIKCNYFN